MSALVKPLTWILGIVLTIIGVYGFFSGGMVLSFQVDTLHNVVHLASGLIALWAANAGQAASKTFLVIFGIIYALVAVLGFMMNGDVLGLMMMNDADNWLHVAIAAACLIVGFGA